MTEDKLTNDQVSALKELKDFVKSEDKEFLLVGYAGVGKTFLINIFGHWLNHENLEFVIAAPTNKAMKVLKEKCPNLKNIGTIHKYLGLSPKKNYQTGNEILQQVKEVQIPDNCLIILDECSMVENKLYEFISKVIVSKKCRFIYVGDNCQLPPVEDE